MCNHYKNGIITDLYNGKVLIDKKVHKIVVLLNKQGFVTSGSCEHISSGEMAGLAWIQFEHVNYFQRLLRVVKNRSNPLLVLFCDPRRAILLGKPTYSGDMKLDMYFQVRDISFFKHQLENIATTMTAKKQHKQRKQIKSKL